jgi:hypothetical protein
MSGTLRATLSLYFIIFLLSCLLACTSKKLKISADSLGVHIHVATLGEYPTTIYRVRLTEKETGKAIWEFRSLAEVVQVWSIDLVIGENSAYPKGMTEEDIAVILPVKEKTVFLMTEVAYRLDIWFAEEGPPRSAYFRF